MGKHWVYILINEEDKAIYVGETNRLYKRIDEHMNGRGCKNTKYFGDVQLVGLYNIAHNDAFEEYHSKLEVFEEWYSIWDLKWKFKDWRKRVEENNIIYKQNYDYLMIENLITEMCIYLNKNNYTDVKGGKYTKKACYKNDIQSYPEHRPTCKCGYPAEVFLSQKDEIWFKCAIENAGWVEYKNFGFSVAEPCNFFQKYNGDFKLRQKFEMLKRREGNEIVRRLPKLNYKVGSEGNWVQELPCSICKNKEYTPVFNHGFRSLCRTCTESRFDEVNKKPMYEFIPDSDDE